MEGFMEGFPSHVDSLPGFSTIPRISLLSALYVVVFLPSISLQPPLPRAVALPSHITPDEDTENPSLTVTDVAVDGDWTSVTFYRYNDELDDDEVSLRPAKVTSSDSQKNLDAQQWLCSPVIVVILCHSCVYVCLTFSLRNPPAPNQPSRAPSGLRSLRRPGRGHADIRDLRLQRGGRRRPARQLQ